RPAGSIPNASSAAASLCPPRLTYGSGASTTTVAGAAMRSPGLWSRRAASPSPTRTLPARIRAWARVRDAARPPSTRSWSRRTRVALPGREQLTACTDLSWHSPMHGYVSSGLVADRPERQPDDPRDHQGHVHEPEDLLDHDDRPGVRQDRDDVREPVSRQGREGQEQQLEPRPRRLRVDGGGERAGPDDLDRAEDVGEGPRQDREQRNERQQLVERHDAVEEHVAQERLADEQVERRVQDARPQHDRRV